MEVAVLDEPSYLRDFLGEKKGDRPSQKTEEYRQRQRDTTTAIHPATTLNAHPCAHPCRNATRWKPLKRSAP